MSVCFAVSWALEDIGELGEGKGEGEGEGEGAGGEAAGGEVEVGRRVVETRGSTRKGMLGC